MLIWPIFTIAGHSRSIHIALAIMGLGLCAIFVPIGLILWGGNRFFGKSKESMLRITIKGSYFVLCAMTLASFLHARDEFRRSWLTIGGAAALPGTRPVNFSRRPRRCNSCIIIDYNRFDICSTVGCQRYCQESYGFPYRSTR